MLERLEHKRVKRSPSLEFTTMEESNARTPVKKRPRNIDKKEEYFDDEVIITSVEIRSAGLATSSNMPSTPLRQTPIALLSDWQIEEREHIFISDDEDEEPEPDNVIPASSVAKKAAKVKKNKVSVAEWKVGWKQWCKSHEWPGPPSGQETSDDDPTKTKAKSYFRLDDTDLLPVPYSTFPIAHPYLRVRDGRAYKRTSLENIAYRKEAGKAGIAGALEHPGAPTETGMLAEGKRIFEDKTRNLEARYEKNRKQRKTEGRLSKFARNSRPTLKAYK